MEEGERQHSEAYQAWMLRLWQVDTGHGVSWRASLQGANTGERRGFEDVEQLCTYLRDLTTPASQGGQNPPERCPD